MPSTGLTQFKLRPAVIVSKDTNNYRLDDVMVAPCTLKVRRQQEPTQFLLEGAEIATSGVRVPSVVRSEALLTIPKTLIVRRLGRLSKAALKSVDGCLRDALSL